MVLDTAVVLRPFKHPTRPNIRTFATNAAFVSNSSGNLMVLRITTFARDCERRFQSTQMIPDYQNVSWVAVVRLRGASSVDPALATISDAEDARGILVTHRGARRLLVSYTSARPRAKPKPRTWMMLAQFSWPVVKPIGLPRRLHIVDAPLARTEKNWVPWADGAHSPHADGLQRFSYSLEPHVVVGCEVDSGRCRVLHNTSSTGIWCERVYAVHTTAKRISGGSGCVRTTLHTEPGSPCRLHTVCSMLTPTAARTAICARCALVVLRCACTSTSCASPTSVSTASSSITTFTPSTRSHRTRCTSPSSFSCAWFTRPCAQCPNSVRSLVCPHCQQCAWRVRCR